MTPAETDELLRLFPRHWPRFTLRQGELQRWRTACALHTPEVALDSLKEWVRWHRDSAPTVGEFVGRCRTAAARRSGPPVRLHLAPELTDVETAPFSAFMMCVLARSVWPWDDPQGRPRPRLTAEEAACQCEAWATAVVRGRPQLARDLRAVAAQYRAVAGEGT